MTKRWLMALVLLLLAVVPSMAQDTANPLILVKKGDLWEWTGGPALRQKTEWGYNYGLSKSPSTQEVAYASMASVVVDYITANGGLGGGPLPTNLWVITTQASDDAYRIADQPADASFMVPGVPENMLMRSGAMWSPDGTQIAWSETAYAQDGTYRLMIYDKASQTTRTVIDGLPPQYGMGAGLSGVWLFEGIVLYSRAQSSTSPSGVESGLIVIDPESGSIRTTLPLSAITKGDETLEPRLNLPVLYQEHRTIGVLYIGQNGLSQWYAVNIENGTLETVSSAPIGEPAQEGPGPFIQVSPRVLANNNVGFNIAYDFYQPDGTPITLTDDPERFVHRFEFSPDGRAIAYQLNSQPNDLGNTIYVWRDGAITTVPETEGTDGIYEFVWGSTWWTMPE